MVRIAAGICSWRFEKKEISKILQHLQGGQNFFMSADLLKPLAEFRFFPSCKKYYGVFAQTPVFPDPYITKPQDDQVRMHVPHSSTLLFSAQLPGICLGIWKLLMCRFEVSVFRFQCLFPDT